MPWPYQPAGPYYSPGYYLSPGLAGHVDNSLALIAAMNRLAAAIEKFNERRFADTSPSDYCAPEKDPA
jgi:hypothetical protein